MSAPIDGLTALGWSPQLAAQFKASSAEGQVPGRIAVAHKGAYRVLIENGEVTARLSGRMRHLATGPRDIPVTGDFVVLLPGTEADRATIVALLPRRTAFSRKAVGKRIEEQLVAANVDTVFLVSGLDGDHNLARLERYLVTARESGAELAIILNKADLCLDLEATIESVRERAESVPVLALSTRSGQGLEALDRYLQPGRTIALIGSSGVGKSTLINRLLGEERLRTREVRLSDDRGRHTTTRRELFILPGGGLIIDTPGLREIDPWDGAEGVGDVFLEIETIAAGCTFGNCGHGGEPGCAVQASVAAGSMPAERLANYRKLKADAGRRDRQDQPWAKDPQTQRAKTANKTLRRFRPR